MNIMSHGSDLMSFMEDIDKGHPIRLPEIKLSAAVTIEYGHKLDRFDVLHEGDFEAVSA